MPTAKRVPTPTTEPWLTVEEASDDTGLPPWRIKRLAYARKIPFSKPYGDRGRMLVRASDVRAFIEAHIVPVSRTAE